MGILFMIIYYIVKYLSYAPAFIFASILVKNDILGLLLSLVFCAIYFFLSISKINFIIIPIIWIAAIILSFKFYPLWVSILLIAIFIITVIRFILAIIKMRKNNESN